MTVTLRLDPEQPRPLEWNPTVFALVSYALPGFLATLLIAVGALGVGWLPLDTALYNSDAVGQLRGTTIGVLLSRLMVLTGVALLLQTWLILGSELMSGIRIRRSALAAVLICWIVPLLLSPPLFSRDVYAYLAQGRLVSKGLDPYFGGVSQLEGWFIEGVDPMWGETPSPYGPLFLVMASWVADLAGDRVFTAALLFRAIAVVGVLAMLVLVPVLAEAHGIDQGKALWLSVLNPLVVMHFVAGGHNDALMVALVLAAFVLAARGWTGLGAGALALATSVKPIALLALPFIGIMRTPNGWTYGRRVLDWVYVSVIAAAVFLATAAAAGVGFGWVAALATPGSVKTWLSPMTGIGMSVGVVVRWLEWAQTDDVPVAIFRSIGLVVSLAIVTLLSLRPQGRSATRSAGLAMLAVVLLGPVVQPWYLLWFIPLLVVTGLTARELRALILVTAGLTLHGMVDGSSTSDSLLELSNGISILLAFAAVGAILLASPKERQLVLQQDSAEGLLPRTPAQRATAGATIVGAPVRG